MSAKVSPDIRFTWNISYDCNYRCSYCFFDGKWEEYRKRNIYLSVNDWMKYWNAIHKKYGRIFLVISGGEPLIYPNFTELIKELSGICYHVNISTNASFNLEKFIQEVDPSNVSISLSFQREFISLADFIEKVKSVRGRGFKGCLNLVAYPPFLGEIKSDNSKLMTGVKEEFKVIPFFGKYNGLDYPQGYSPEEKKLINIDEGWFKKIRRKGSLCAAGCNSVLLFPDGKVARCGQIGEKFLLGNFFSPDFKLLDRPLPCESEFCPCQEDSVDGKEDTSSLKMPDDVKIRNSGVPDNGSNLSLAPVKDRHSPMESPSALKRESSGPKREAVSSRVKFTWDIHYKCNFRCPYCWFYKDWARLGERSLYLGPDEWMLHWRRIYDKYGETKIEIVGGEPFIYPNFIELVKRLSTIHLIKITTNLSGNIEQFVKEVNPERVELDLNFHILFIDLETVIKKTLILKKAGFKGGVCYLAYPPQMHKIRYLSEEFKKVGINFALAAFWGEYDGKKYPEAYTEEEKETMRPFLGDIDRIAYHLNAQSPKGKLCNAGFTYADIQADGNVVRCAPLGEKSIGNITDEKFCLLKEPSRCEAEACPCNEYDNLVRL